MKRSLILVLLIAATALSININIDHLEFLRDEFKIEEDQTTGYWIYADRLSDSSYKKLDAPGEGATCIDDVARAAIFYLRFLEKDYENEFYQIRSKEALDFVLSLQLSDGSYYNFVFPDGTINKNGPTSRPGGNWWAARAFWATALGARIFRNINSEYSKKLARSAKKTYKLLSEFTTASLLQGYTDMSSVMLLGMVELEKYDHSDELVSVIKEMGIAIASNLVTDGFIAGLFDEGKNGFDWHGWGSRQIEALGAAYLVTGDKYFLDIAEKALQFSGNLIISVGPVYSISKYVSTYPQLAYAAECYVNSAKAIYEITSNEEYALLAILAADWFLGLNKLNQPMIGNSGQGFDGLEITHRNLNSGSESTICSLLALQGIADLPETTIRFFVEETELLTPAYLIESEKMHTGLSPAIVIQDNTAGGKALLELNGTSVLRDTVLIPDTIYEVYGIIHDSEMENGEISLRLAESRSIKIVELKEESISFLGEISGTGDKQTFTVAFKMDDNKILELDQIFLLPKVVAVYFPATEETLLINWKIPPHDSRYPYGLTIQKGRYLNLKKPVTEISIGEEVTAAKYSGNYILDIEKMFNNDGTASVSDRRGGNFDNVEGLLGASYPEEEILNSLQDGILYVNEVPFKLDLEEKDNIRLGGQVLNIEISGQKICFLGASDHGNYIEPVRLVYLDGTSFEFNLGFSDWCANPVYGETVALQLPFRYESNGNIQKLDCKIYKQCFEIPTGKIVSIVLPDKITMHLFAITIVR